MIHMSLLDWSTLVDHVKMEDSSRQLYRRAARVKKEAKKIIFLRILYLCERYDLIYFNIDKLKISLGMCGIAKN